MTPELKELFDFTSTLDPMDIFPYISGEELTKEQEQKWLDWKTNKDSK